MHAKKLRQYNLIFTTVAFLMIMLAIIIAIAFNKQQQIFFSEAQNFAKTATISVSQTKVSPGAQVSVLVYVDRSVAKDWIGLFGADAAKPLATQYLTQCDLTQQATARIGYCTFVMPDTQGQYVFRLMRDNLFIKASGSLTVDAAAATDAVVE